MSYLHPNILNQNAMIRNAINNEKQEIMQLNTIFDAF